MLLIFQNTVKIFSIICVLIKSSYMLKVDIELINEHSAQLTWSDFEECLDAFTLTLSTLKDNYHHDYHVSIIKANESPSSIKDDKLMPGFWNNIAIKPSKADCQHDKEQVLPHFFATKPLPLEKLKCESNSSKVIYLSWKDPEASSSYFLEHQIKVRDDNGNLVHEKNLSRDSKSWKYDQAVPGQLYKIELYANSFNGNYDPRRNEGFLVQSDPVQCSFRTKPLTPQSPQGADIIPTVDDEFSFTNSISPWHFMVIFGVAGAILLVGLVVFTYHKWNGRRRINNSPEHNYNMLDIMPIDVTLDDNVPRQKDDIIIKIEQLEIGEIIGIGQFGEVRRALLKRKNGLPPMQVAIKKALAGQNMSQKDKEEITAEALIMNSFHHDNVLSLIGISFDNNGFPILVMPRMNKGSLIEFIKNKNVHLQHHELLKFALDVAQGMEYLSNKKYVHRDLAARNCLLDDKLTVKVADFGLTKQILDKAYYIPSDKKPFPYRWMALESLENGVYTTKTDVYSFGVLLWQLMTRGEKPFADFLDCSQLIHHLKNGGKLPNNHDIPKIIYDLILYCGAIEDFLRPTFTEICSKLKMLHNLFKNQWNSGNNDDENQHNQSNRDSYLSHDIIEI